MRILQLGVGSLALACAASCSQPPIETGPLAANGLTKVRYVNCAVDDTNCFVAARFLDLADCNAFKQFSDMQCVPSNSPLVVVTCKWQPGQRRSVAYCIK